MEHDGVGDMEVDVNYLSDTELSQKLRQLGANIGPITGMCLCQVSCAYMLLLC